MFVNWFLWGDRPGPSDLEFNLKTTRKYTYTHHDHLILVIPIFQVEFFDVEILEYLCNGNWNYLKDIENGRKQANKIKLGDTF